MEILYAGKGKIAGSSLLFLFTRFLQEGGQYDSVDIFEMDLDIWELLMNFLWRYSQVQKVSPKSA